MTSADSGDDLRGLAGVAARVREPSCDLAGKQNRVDRADGDACRVLAPQAGLCKRQARTGERIGDTVAAALADAREHVNDRRDVKRVLNLVERECRAATVVLGGFRGDEEQCLGPRGGVVGVDAGKPKWQALEPGDERVFDGALCPRARVRVFDPANEIRRSQHAAAVDSYR